MSPEDKRKVLTTLVAVYAYYGKEFPEVAGRFWIDDLDGHDIDAIERAFVRHRRDPERGRFLPLTADILRQLNGDADEAALVSWGKVLECARAGGGHFNGATQQALDSMGGMGRIRMASPSENGFLQREFCAAFRAYKARDDRKELTDGRVSALVARIGAAS